MGGLTENSLPRRWSEECTCQKQKTKQTLRLTSWTVVDMLEVFEFPLRPRCSLVSSPLPLLVLEPQMSANYNTKAVVTLTSILLLSFAAVSKSPSLIPLATTLHNRLFSHSPCSPTGATVTSSFGVVTSWKTPLRESCEVVCHVPSITCGFWRTRGGGDTVALNECDFPEK